MGHGTQAATPRALEDFIRSSVASGQGTMSPFGSQYPDYRDRQLAFWGLAPPLFPIRQVSLGNIWINVHAQARLVIHLHESVHNIRPIQQQ